MLWYHLFLAGMAMVMLADDAYAFMVAWEVMALSSYFLVTTDHAIPEIRRAGFLYLLIAHVGAVALLLCFGVLQGGHGAYTFEYMRHAGITPFWSSAAFLLALFGFGAKAGLVPLHVWLPEAHPAAPSPVSALMSGIMLKTAIYGLLRVTFDLLNVQLVWWGTLALALGLLTALYGVIFAAVQSDMKRLLAWSSIENIGILVAAFGLTLIFYTDGQGALAALTLTAMLYHALNHAFFKGLLFLGTGAVLHSTGERHMGKLGGLMRFMPWTAWLTLIGALAIAGLPPLNGFVSEWLLLQAFLLTPGLTEPYLNMVIPVAAASVALAAALAAYVMVKFFGVVFLGQPRDAALQHAHEASWPKRLGMIWLAAGCVVLGLFPAQVIAWLAPVVRAAHQADAGQRRQLADAGARVCSACELRAADLPGGGRASCCWCFVWVTRVYHGRVRRADPWDCGYPEQDARMQDSAEGFGQPIRQIFSSFMRVERDTPDPFDRHPALPRRQPRQALDADLQAHRRSDRMVVGAGRAAAARPHPVVSDVQLRHADLPARFCDAVTAMSIGILLQIAQTLIAILLAPLLMGWVNQCRAWLQGRRAPPITQPYRTLQQAVPQGRGDRPQRPPLFRFAPYMIFACMALAAGHGADHRQRPAALAGGRRHRAGRHLRPGPGVSWPWRRWTSAPPSAAWAHAAKCSSPSWPNRRC